MRIVPTPSEIYAEAAPRVYDTAHARMHREKAGLLMAGEVLGAPASAGIITVGQLEGVPGGVTSVGMLMGLVALTMYFEARKSAYYAHASEPEGTCGQLAQLPPIANPG